MNQKKNLSSWNLTATFIWAIALAFSLSAALLPGNVSAAAADSLINFMRKQKKKERLRFMRRYRLRPCRLFRLRS